MAGFAEGLAADPRLGQLLGEYRIKELLGRGGMGVVYLAVHERLERNVALKLLAPALAQNEVVRERFIRESRRAAAIDHPNIIPVYEAGEVDGHLFIAMRYVAGLNLRELLTAEGGRIGPERAVQIIGQVGSALDAAHSVGLVHRDVKPANVMVDPGGGAHGEHCYLTDFGLTKDISSSTGFTDTGQFVGTIHYVAPEQVDGRPLDSRTDIYALGCVLYESLTGQVPFPRENDLAVMFAHVSEPPPRPSAARTDLPPGLDDVIGRAMAKSPDDRHRTCSELVADARAVLAGGQPSKPAPAVPAPSPSPAASTAAPPPAASTAAPSHHAAAPPPAAPPPPSHAWTSPEPAQPAFPPAGPPPSWPPLQAPADKGPNYTLAAAIVAIAVLLTTAGVVAALVLSKGDDAGGGGKPSASESAEARRLIEQTADLNRDVIRLEERIAGGKSSEKKLVARLERERKEAERLQATTQRQLGKLRRVQTSLVASNRLVKKATGQLEKYLDTKSPGILDSTTVTIGQAVQESNNAAEAYQADSGSQTETIPEGMQVDPADLPAVTLNVPEDANVKLKVGVEGAVEAMTGAGDVNGDGRGDLVATYNAEGLSGAYVVFGQPDATEIDLTQLGENGFEITTSGTSAPDGVAPAGDVDGDGNDDILIPATGESDGVGTWFVVFGSDTTATIDLDTPGDRVATIEKAEPAPDISVGLSHVSAVGVGDVTGDGRGDVAIGSPREGTTGPGEVWVVTDLAAGATADLDDLGDSGFQIDGAPSESGFGGTLAPAGDVNGDKVDDVLIGAPDQRGRAGGAYVVFGAKDSGDVDVSNLGERGIVLRGGAGTAAGGAVSKLGDVNGDDLDDFAVGAPLASPDGRERAGVAYVVFGRRETARIDLTDLGANGYRIDGQAAALYEASDGVYGLGTGVAPVGDANGDGKPDLIVNATTTDPDDLMLAYVVYGKADPTRVDLGDPGGQAIGLKGESGAFARIGDGVDFDGDDLSELPVTLGGEGLSTSDGYLFKVKR